METTLDGEHSVETLIKKSEEYVGIKGELLKYKAVEKVSAVTSEVVAIVCVIAVFIPFFALLNIGFCLWLGSKLGSVPAAFFIMSGFYLLIGLILLFAGRKAIKRGIANLIIKHALK